MSVSGPVSAAAPLRPNVSAGVPMSSGPSPLAVPTYTPAIGATAQGKSMMNTVKGFLGLGGARRRSRRRSTKRRAGRKGSRRAGRKGSRRVRH